MAERSGLSKTTIWRIWRAFDLKPHRVDAFKRSKDSVFVDNAFEVVGLYASPRSSPAGSFNAPPPFGGAEPADPWGHRPEESALSLAITWRW